MLQVCKHSNICWWSSPAMGVYYCSYLWSAMGVLQRSLTVTGDLLLYVNIQVTFVIGNLPCSFCLFMELPNVFHSAITQQLMWQTACQYNKEPLQVKVPTKMGLTIWSWMFAYQLHYMKKKAVEVNGRDVWSKLLIYFIL